jgi:hypothetical protein
LAGQVTAEFSQGEYRLAPADQIQPATQLDATRAPASPAHTGANTPTVVRITSPADVLSSGDAAAAAGPRTTHFTAVTEAELRQAELASSRDEEGWTRWLSIGALSLGVLLAVGFVFNAVRPVTADGLWRRIQPAIESAEGDIEQFLSQFPHDERAAGLAEYREEIDLFRLQRQFELKARRLGGVEGLSPAERAYLQAVRTMPADPERALEQFTAIVAVFSRSLNAADEPAEHKAAARCVELSRKQARRLKVVVEQSQTEQRQFLRRRLDALAKELADHPTQAAAGLRGIITLYADRPWAVEFVAQAEQLLAKAPQEDAADKQVIDNSAAP